MTATASASSAGGVSNGHTVVCKGADQSVISKLRNNLEQKEIEKQKVLKNTANAVDEDPNKSAEIARIRTKGELKGFTPLPPVSVPPPSLQPPAQTLASQPSQSKPIELELPAKAIIDVNKPTEILCKMEVESTTSAFDLMDWGSTCNDFLKQLQNGGGASTTKKRTATKGPRRAKLDDGHDTSTSSKSSKDTVVAPPPKPSASTSKTNDSSSDDEDDNKPLHLLRQQSLSENSKSQNDSEPKMNTPSKGSPSSKASKIAKEKQRDKREREKRLLSLGSSSSDGSDSEHEAVDDRRPAKTSGSFSTPKRKLKSLASQRTPRASLSNRDDEHSGDVTAPGKKDKMKAAQKKRGRRQSSSDSDVVVQKPAKKTKSKQLLDDSSSNSSSSSGADIDRDDDEGENTSDMNNGPHHDAEETIPAHIVKKKKSSPVANKVEETMTRSKRKRELETQIANSKVLRNDKMIKCVAPPSVDTKSTTTTTPTKRQSKSTSESSAVKGQQPQQQISASESSKSRTKKRTSPAADSDNDDSKSPNPKRKSTRSSKIQTSSSESEESALSEAEPENVTERLRSRKSKTSPAALASSSAEKPNGAKKDEKPLTRRASKCTPTKKAVASAGAIAPELDVSEESRFQPGWEEEVYEFKRSLKIPASLITVGRPSWHRKSTSLPDLDPQHSSDASESFGSEINKKIRAKVSEATSLASTPLKKRPCGGSSSSKKVVVPIAEQATTSDVDSKTKSIIDVLHQRVFRPMARKKMRQHSNQNEPKILPQTNEAELLPTPGSKGNVFKSENVFETAVLKSRTRKEYRAMKNQEIIREVFGGEDRPASAPPAHFDVAAAAVQVKQEPKAETQQLTYDQQYDQYLKQMNIDYGERIRKLKGSTTATVTSTTASSTAATPLLIPKIEKMDEDSLLNPDDDETQDTELNACFDANKDALGERVDTPSVLSEVDGATPTSFKGVLKSGKKARSNRHSRRKGSSGKFALHFLFSAVNKRLIRLISFCRFRLHSQEEKTIASECGRYSNDGDKTSISGRQLFGGERRRRYYTRNSQLGTE